MMKPASSPWVRDVSEATFEADVIVASDEAPVIVDFWSPGCAPCRALGPLLERLTNEREGKVFLAKVNVDDCPNLADYFGINAIPAVKVIFQRQLVHEFEGLLPEKTLREFFDQLAPDARDADLVNMAEWEEAVPADAEKLYREKIAQEPDKHEARVGLARVLLRLDRLDEIPEVLEPVGASGELGAASDGILAQVFLIKNAKALPDEKTLRQRLAADPDSAQVALELGSVLAAKGDGEEALRHLYAAAERDFKLAQGKAREIMVKVFYVVGSNHPLANEYRSKLSRLLY